MEKDALVAPLVVGTSAGIKALKATVSALTGPVGELEPPPAAEKAAPQAWVDYATAADRQDLAGWVDWLVTGYDFPPSCMAMPCWPAHYGVADAALLATPRRRRRAQGRRGRCRRAGGGAQHAAQGAVREPQRPSTPTPSPVAFGDASPWILRRDPCQGHEVAVSTA